MLGCLRENARRAEHFAIWVLLNPPITDQPTTDYLLTDPPTNQPPTHRPTDSIITDPTDKILFQRLDK